MQKSLNTSKKDSSQINLSNIYTDKELESMKKIFPQLSTLITSNPSTATTKRLSFQQNPKSNQFVEREKFVKLITDQMMNMLNKEESEILGKSISYLLKSDDANIDKHRRNTQISAKTFKNNYFKNMSEKSNLFGENTLFQRRKTNYKKVNFQLKTENNINIPKIMKKLDINVKNIDNTVRSNLGKKYIDLKHDNDTSNYKIKNIKNNSIINNYITISNTTKPEQIISYDTKTTLNKKSNVSNTSSTSNKSNILKRNSVKAKVIPFNYTYNYIETEKNKGLENKNIKKSFYSRRSNIKIDNANSNNFIKKIDKIKTEINLQKRIGNILPPKRKSDVYKEIKTPVSFINLNDNSLPRKKTLKPRKTNPNLKENYNIDDFNFSSYSSIESKDFDIFNFESKVGQENTLYMIGSYIYKKFDFSKIIKQKKFANWAKKIAAGYSRLNPYHTDLHGADVTQTCFISLLQDGVKEIAKVDNIDICSLILSCMCHDFKHFGLNNNFLKLTKHKLAIRYNDISILENMHISETFKLINSNPDCNIFFDVDKTTYEKMRKKMISCVLSTDMFYHSNHTQFMKDLIAKKDIKQEDNQQYMNLLIHAADISNPTKPFNIYLKWAKLVLEEFCQQGDKEKALGLVCTSDRKKVKLNTNQIGFIDYVVEDFVSSFVKIFPSLKFLHDNLVDNRAKFVNYKEDEKGNNNIIKKVIKK